MKRKGSPFKGTAVIAFKEAADHMQSARMHLIMLLVLLTAAGALYGAIDQLRQVSAQDDFLFLKLLTTAKAPVPAFSSLLGFLLPLVAIALGFDAVNGEFSRRTMSRILAQPVYRDAVLFGKFLGAMLVIAIALMVLWLLMIGCGILTLGQLPSGGDLTRGTAFFLATLVYTGVWLAMAMSFSTFIKSPATSALTALAVWLIMTVFWNMLTPMVAAILSPVDRANPMTVLDQFYMAQGLSRISPANLYGEIGQMLLDPTSRALGPIFTFQMQGALVGNPLGTWQSIAIVWPQFASMLAAMLVLFTLAYVAFQRQEVRA